MVSNIAMNCGLNFFSPSVNTIDIIHILVGTDQ